MSVNVSELFRETLDRELPELRALPDAAAAIRPGGENTWSPKEELGHLIDSAANNHVRFVQALIQPECRGSSYAQNAWVEAHGYQDMPWPAIVEFWFQYNTFLVRL